MSNFIWWFGAITAGLYAAFGSLFAIGWLADQAIKRVSWWPTFWRFLLAEIKARSDARRSKQPTP